MKPAQLTRRIAELSENLKPVASEGIRFDFHSFTKTEQLVILKNCELQEKYGAKWSREVIIANLDLIVKCNEIAAQRATELFLFTMPRALMLDELEQWFFKFNFNEFLRRWIECQKNLKKWSKKDREDFLRDIKIETKPDKEHNHEVITNGEENNN